MNINGAKLLYKKVALDSTQQTSALKYLRSRFKDVLSTGNLEYTAIEHSPGVNEHIFTIRSPLRDKPILQRIRINNGTNTASQTFYNRTQDLRTGNYGLRTTTYKYSGNNQPDITTRTVDIVPNSKDVTIAESLITQGEQGSKITSEITEKSSGKINKQLKRTTEYAKDETTILSDKIENQGLTEKDINNAKKYLNLDEYFHGRFMDMKSFIQKFRKTILKNQKVSSDLPMEPVWLPKRARARAIYLDEKKKIIISDLSKEFRERDFSQMIANLNHEARHAWQYELVEKLNKGQLTNPEEIKLAEKFKKNIENYISPQNAKTYEEYASQPIEADAFNAGDYSNINYDISSLYLSDIFKKASKGTLGG